MNSGLRWVSLVVGVVLALVLLRALSAPDGVVFTRHVVTLEIMAGDVQIDREHGNEGDYRVIGRRGWQELNWGPIDDDISAETRLRLSVEHIVSAVPRPEDMGVEPIVEVRKDSRTLYTQAVVDGNRRILATVWHCPMARTWLALWTRAPPISAERLHERSLVSMVCGTSPPVQLSGSEK